MNIYKATVSKGYNSANVEVNVLAKSAAEAVANVERYAKANYYSSYEITGLIKVLKVDVHYATAAKKRK